MKGHAPNEMIRFDWAMKHRLRNKTDFRILNGLISTVLGKKISIQGIMESESNPKDEVSKYDRIDVVAQDEEKQLFIIEVQNNPEYVFFQRMVFGMASTVTDYINKGQGYEHIRKVYSINIVYFQLGEGDGIVYRGKTEFRETTTGEVLGLSKYHRQRFNVDEVSDLFPEYYILKVNNFQGEPTTPLEEWIYYLKTGIVKEGNTAQGLEEVREQLMIDMMSDQERRSYYSHIDNRVILQDTIVGSREEGLMLGREMGRAEGIAAEKIATAKKMKAKGMSIEDIIEITGLSEEEIMQVL